MNTTITSVRAWACCLLLALPALVLANSPAVRSTYKVETGDTLDKVIKKTMPDSPLRVDILRNAFVQQNPQAFTKSPPALWWRVPCSTCPVTMTCYVPTWCPVNPWAATACNVAAVIPRPT